ncbi:unnamed protein product, partial [Prunus brigantina]
MDPIHAHLTDGTLSTDKIEAKAIQRRSARYLLFQGILYRRSTPYRCYNVLLHNEGTISCEKYTKAGVVTIRNPDLWPSKTFTKATIGQLSILTPSRLCK